MPLLLQGEHGVFRRPVSTQAALTCRKAFHACMGTSLGRYQRKLCIQRAQYELKETDSVTEIIGKLHFPSITLQHFFKKHTGIPPIAYRALTSGKTGSPSPQALDATLKQRSGCKLGADKNNILDADLRQRLWWRLKYATDEDLK